VDFYYGKPSLNGQSFQGNAPTIQVSMKNLYPAGVSWVQFYKGTPSNPLSTATAISTTQGTAKSTDLDVRNFNVDLSTIITTPGVWTVEAVQRTIYGDKHLNTPATFTVINTVNVNTALGLLK
jgi:hypothetical protein